MAARSFASPPPVPPANTNTIHRHACDKESLNAGNGTFATLQPYTYNQPQKHGRVRHLVINTPCSQVGNSAHSNECKEQNVAGVHIGTLWYVGADGSTAASIVYYDPLMNLPAHLAPIFDQQAKQWKRNERNQKYALQAGFSPIFIVCAAARGCSAF